MSLFARTREPALQRADAAYVSHTHAAALADPVRHAAWALYLMLLMVIAAIAWAASTRVDDITRADGRVVPEGREQVIASLEGGILHELYVREGMQVDPGQALAQIDPTRFESQQKESGLRRLALKASQARLNAEAGDKALAFPLDVAAAPALVAAETEAYAARRRSLQQGLSANQRSIDLLQREKGMSEAMAAKGLLSDVEVMRLARQVNELQLQSQERINRFSRNDFKALRQRRYASEFLQLLAQSGARVGPG